MKTIQLLTWLRQMIELDAILKVYSQGGFTCRPAFDAWRHSLKVTQKETGISRQRLMELIDRHADAWVLQNRTERIRRAQQFCQNKEAGEHLQRLMETVQTAMAQGHRGEKP